MLRKLVSIASVGCFVAISAAACGSSRDSFDPDALDGGAASSSGDSVRTPPPSGPIGGSSSGASGGTEQDSGLPSCAAETQAGKQLPLDIHIMLDASGSMMSTTGVNGTGPTKWAAVKTALSGFINDGSSAGIGVGLGIFPVKNANAPASCTSNAQCTVNGVNMGHCGLKFCSPPLNSTDPLRTCETSADCPNNAACRALGRCRTGIFAGGECLKDDPNYECSTFPINYKCEPYTESICWQEQCVLGDYDDARVPIAALPGNANPLVSSMNAIPDPPETALTPTAGALEGGLIYAKNYKTQHPDHVVVMVLATDGLPTRCNTTDIPGIAAIAAASANGSPSIKTYVIGVFADAEQATAKANLDAIAAGGGTGSAFIVTTSSNVTQQFQQALEAIRGEALPCEYLVPKPEAGTPDYDKVNVQFTSGGQSSLIGYKKKAADCDAAGGWYYDVDPSSGGTPTKISLCPTSCSAVKSGGAGAKIDVLLGCKTIVK